MAYQTSRVNKCQNHPCRRVVQILFNPLLVGGYNFPKGISLKVNKIGRLEFELAYIKVAFRPLLDKDFPLTDTSLYPRDSTSVDGCWFNGKNESNLFLSTICISFLTLVSSAEQGPIYRTEVPLIDVNLPPVTLDMQGWQWICILCNFYGMDSMLVALFVLSNSILGLNLDSGFINLQWTFSQYITL